MHALKRLSVAVIFLSAVCVAAADDYPSSPITMVVGFGVGGSADRMSRAMSRFIADEIGQPIQVVNKKGAGTLLAANFVLERPHDGYTLFASAFSPYLTNTVLEGYANYTIDDFAYVNFQWFDEDLIAISKRSQYKNLGELLAAARNKPKTVRASVVRGSAGHLMAKLLMEVNGIPPENLNVVAYNSGGQARAAVAGGVVDFIVISAEGCKGIREYIQPIAIVSDERTADWDAPTLNEALTPLGVQAPWLPGSTRGFATTAAFKQQYPDRFNKLAGAIEKALQRPELQTILQQSSIGGRWVGPEKSTQVMRDTFDTLKKYAYLLEIK